jgi:hypothetical protein
LTPLQLSEARALGRLDSANKTEPPSAVAATVSGVRSHLTPSTTLA